MRAAVKFSLLCGTLSSSRSSSFGDDLGGRSELGSMGNSQAGSVAAEGEGAGAGIVAARAVALTAIVNAAVVHRECVMAKTLPHLALLAHPSCRALPFAMVTTAPASCKVRAIEAAPAAAGVAP